MSGRVADALLYFSDEVFRSDEYEMIFSRQELGEMTSMAKECVVRILKEFEDSGVVYSDSSKIKILDKEKLIQISEKGMKGYSDCRIWDCRIADIDTDTGCRTFDFGLRTSDFGQIN